MQATALLLALAERGIHLRAEGDALRYRPASKTPQELVEAIRVNKGELLALLTWEEDDAFALVREALASVAARYVAGEDLTYLRPYGDAVDAAFAAEDMHRLRVSCHRYARAMRQSPREAA